MGVNDCFWRYLSSMLLAMATWMDGVHRARVRRCAHHEEDEPCGETLYGM